jgi:hypothetical protein
MKRYPSSRDSVESARPANIAAHRIDPAIEALLRLLAKFAGAGSGFERRRVAEETQRALGAVERDLDLTAYEPPSIGPEQSWVDRRRRILTAVEALTGPLLLSAGQAPALDGVLQRRLECVASEFASRSSEERQASGAIGQTFEPAKTDDADDSAIEALVYRPLAALERAVSRSPSPEQSRLVAHAPA